MPERTPQERISSQRLEVNTGLTKEMAMREARRCQDCANPTCMEGCPVGIDIPGFIKNIAGQMRYRWELVIGKLLSISIFTVVLLVLCRQCADGYVHRKNNVNRNVSICKK